MRPGRMFYTSKKKRVNIFTFSTFLKKTLISFRNFLRFSEDNFHYYDESLKNLQINKAHDWAKPNNCYPSGNHDWYCFYYVKTKEC